MTCVEMTSKLKGFKQPNSHVFLDAKPGLDEIRDYKRVVRDDGLPWIVLSSFGDKPMTGDALLRFLQSQAPQGSELYYGDREQPEELKPIRDVQLMELTELMKRGFDEETAPAIVLCL